MSVDFDDPMTRALRNWKLGLNDSHEVTVAIEKLIDDRVEKLQPIIQMVVTTGLPYGKVVRQCSDCGGYEVVDDTDVDLLGDTSPGAL